MFSKMSVRDKLISLTITVCLLSAYCGSSQCYQISQVHLFLFKETCIPEKKKKLGNADDEVENTDWDEIHIRNFKCSINTCLCSYYFKIFHKAIALMIFYLKLSAEIPLTVIFVIISPNLSLIFSVNVTLLDPFGKSCSRLLKINMILIFQFQILIGFLETNS